MMGAEQLCWVKLMEAVALSACCCWRVLVRGGGTELQESKPALNSSHKPRAVQG